MRQIGVLDSLSLAKRFYFFLLHEKVDSHYEPSESEGSYTIWVVNEDDHDKAIELFKQFKANPEDNKYKVEPPSVEPAKQVYQQRITPVVSNIQYAKCGLTKLIIFVCVILYFWVGYQKAQFNIDVNEPPTFPLLTSIEASLIYDYPLAFRLYEQFYTHYGAVKSSQDLPQEGRALLVEIEQNPPWVGFYQVMLHTSLSDNFLKAKMFVDLKRGEIWRLFTPIFLHAGFLHILFNMLWFWMLSRAVEPRIGKWRYLLLVLIVAGISNTAQYLMSGPLFMGMSGVITGLGGFIWVRMKKAPWEGYLMYRGALLFLGFFVLFGLAIQVIAFILDLLEVASYQIPIANTVHIVGAVVGMLMAALPLYKKINYDKS